MKDGEPKKRERRKRLYEEEYRDLLALLAKAVGGCSTRVSVTANDKVLYGLARKHAVVNLLAYAWQGREDLDPALRTALDRDLFASVRQQAEQEHEAACIAAELRKAGIRFFLMKGIVLRREYPRPDMRTSCDVDIFYDRTCRKEADAMMAARGYTRALSDPNHDEYTKPPYVTVELHRNLLTDLPTVDRYYADIWARLEAVEGSEYRMRAEDFYIYQTVHTMKHFRHAGTGIRSVLDTYIFLRAHPELDRVYVDAELEKLGLRRFAEVLEGLAASWFGGAPEPEWLSEIAAYILGSGVYGTGVQAAANRAPERRGGKLRYALSRAFPPLRLMREKYPMLARMPFLLPVFWGYRLVRALFCGRDRMGKEMRALQAADAEQMERVVRVMEQAGLRGYR